LFFDYTLEIVINEVIGWDMNKGQARQDKPGLFGTPQAFTVTGMIQATKYFLIALIVLKHGQAMN